MRRRALTRLTLADGGSGPGRGPKVHAHAVRPVLAHAHAELGVGDDDLERGVDPVALDQVETKPDVLVVSDA